MRDRLTYRESETVWGVFGVDINKLPENLYSVARKLFEYEETGLKPAEVEDLQSTRTLNEKYFLEHRGCEKNYNE